ncbi:MAG TPA: NYN domain-containing protein [Ottowia sp.]|uniref:NYN domain-containing protein n=1 Tax=Ottowia sp. TaxID=1898956 RepID=UPI002CB3E380|nr:NYN domain-containing protein [Ottowia sp.]HMN20177.1 NYN domain-containing protein [Ottowia sp.]
MPSENLKPEKLAVLIDADNTTAACAQDLLEEIAKYGIANVKRIYGDWSSPALGGWRSILLKHALVPIQQFAYTRGKDATDEANRMYCRKIPFIDLVKLLDEAFNKFRSAKGWANLDVVEKYVKPRWNWQEYGFDSFPDLLARVDHVDVGSDGMRMQAPPAS